MITNKRESMALSIIKDFVIIEAKRQFYHEYRLEHLLTNNY